MSGDRELNPGTVIHLSTNRAPRRITSLIEANALTTTPDRHSVYQVFEVLLLALADRFYSQWKSMSF